MLRNRRITVFINEKKRRTPTFETPGFKSLQLRLGEMLGNRKKSLHQLSNCVISKKNVVMLW